MSAIGKTEIDAFRARLDEIEKRLPRSARNDKNAGGAEEGGGAERAGESLRGGEADEAISIRLPRSLRSLAMTGAGLGLMGLLGFLGLGAVVLIGKGRHGVSGEEGWPEVNSKEQST